MIPSRILGTLFAAGALIAVAFPTAAQVETKKTEAVGEPTHQVTVQRGEVMYVSGNNVMVKMEDGTVRAFNNVPDSVTVTVDGQALNVHQLKPGMKIERQTITTTTPRVVTTVQTVTGKVWSVSPPNSVVLTLENGQNQQFKIPQGQKFTINGRETDAFGLRKGMVVSAQKVTEVPETVVSEQITRTGTAPPPPPPVQQDIPVLVVYMQSVPTPAKEPAETASAEQPPHKMPTTASNVPLVGLVGLGLFFGSLVAIAIGRMSRIS
jgi:hypothetical protein